MKNKGRLLADILWAVLFIAYINLFLWGFLAYQDHQATAGDLQEELKGRELALVKQKQQLRESERQSVSLTEELKELNREKGLLEEEIERMHQAGVALEKQLEKLTSQRQALEVEVKNLAQAHQQELSLKEKDFQAKIAGQKKEFSLQEQGLKDQIVLLEAKLDVSAQENKILSEQLQENQDRTRESPGAGPSVKVKEPGDKEKTKTAELSALRKENRNLSARLEKNKKNIEQIQKELKQAKEELKREKAKFHYNLGLVYDENSRYEEALDEYKQALKIAPEDADVHYNLGIIYDEHVIDKKKAVKHYQTYLDLRPEARDRDKVAYWISKVERELTYEVK